MATARTDPMDTIPAGIIRHTTPQRTAPARQCCTVAGTETSTFTIIADAW